MQPEGFTGPEVGKEFEVQQLLLLNDYVWTMADRDSRPSDPYVPDVGIDYMYDYCAALARRDPEIGHMLVDAFAKQFRETGNSNGDHIHSNLRTILGLPPADFSLQTE